MSTVRRPSIAPDHDRPPNLRRFSSKPAPPLALPLAASSSPRRHDDKDGTSVPQSRRRTFGPGWFAKGMRNDIRARVPWYWSDWADAWNYRVIPATWVSSLARAGRWKLKSHSVHLLRECLPRDRFLARPHCNRSRIRETDSLLMSCAGNDGPVWCTGGSTCIGRLS
jgi:hypothetical protein